MALAGSCAQDEVLRRSAPQVERLTAADGRYVGVAVRAGLLEDPGYAALVPRAFTAVTPENELKWEAVHPEPDRYDFAASQRIVALARRHGMTVRGHALTWHLQNPGWLEQGRFSRSQLTEVLRSHIRTVVGRFRKDIAEWDVVNEAVDDDGSLRDNVWLRGIGPQYIDLAFRFAREADPDARLYYNDFGAEGEGPKARGVLRLLRGLRDRGVPVDGVGLQGHIDPRPVPRLRETLRSYAALGLDVAFTELDVRVPGEPSAADLRAQARQYARVGRACTALERCRGIVVWGLDDADSWIPDAFPGFGAATLFDGDLRPKPAYEALRRALR